MAQKVYPKEKSHRSDTKTKRTKLLNFTFKKTKIKTQTGSKVDFPNREHYQSSQELLELLDGKVTEKPQH